MKPIQGYHLIKPEDLSWRPSNLMKIPNADYLERTGSENMGARLWRLPPGSANTLHKHIRAEEFYFVLEGTGRIRITITANTSWQGLPAGVDGQTLVLIVVSGAFTFELLALDSSTALHQIMASANSSYEEYDAAQLVYSSSLSNWVLIL